jgi:ribonuclease-3
MKNLQKKLGLKFKKPELLTMALTHRSYLNEHRGEKLEHNERLEFLGDAVLELVVTEYLFNTFTGKPEGELTNLRASLVKGDNLSKVGTGLAVDDYLRLSRGESKSRDRSRNYLVANAMEAIIGALYLDQGYPACKKFITRHIIKELPRIIREQSFRDAKSLFQEKTQEKLGLTPTYKLISQTGPDHDKKFKVGACLDGKTVSTGEGKSKQEAQQQAAQNFLDDEKQD